TWTEMTSPTLPAATAPASVAALTAPTSPRTMTVTSPPPICSRPTRRTMAATRPLVSMRPRAPEGTRPFPFPSVGMAAVSFLSRLMVCVTPLNPLLLEGDLTADDHAVDDGHHRGVGRRPPRRGRDAGGAAVRHQDDLALPGSDDVDGGVGLAVERHPVGVSGVEVLHQEDLEAVQAGFLDGGDHLADNFGEPHGPPSRWMPDGSHGTAARRGLLCL